AGSVLSLASITGAAAPGHAVGFEDASLDAKFAGKVDRAGKAGVAGTDDGDIGIDIAQDSAIRLRRLSGGRDPIGRRVISIVSGALRNKRIVVRFVGRDRRRLLHVHRCAVSPPPSAACRGRSLRKALLRQTLSPRKAK